MRPSRPSVVAVAVLGAALAVGAAPPAVADPVAPAVVFSPTSVTALHLDWRGLVAQPLSIVNHTTASVRVGPLTASDRRMVVDSRCEGVVIAAGGSCATGYLLVDDGVTSQYSVTIRGMGTSMTVFATVDPPVVVTAAPVFPATPDGTTTAKRTVALRNNSNRPVTFGTTATPDDGAFVFSAARCLGTTIQPGRTCSVDVAYRPRGDHADVGHLSVPVVHGLPVVVTAQGSYVPRSIPDTLLLDFGTVPRGDTATRTLTYRNTSAARSVLGTSSLTGGPYRIVSDTCAGRSIAAGASCVVTVAVRPTLGTTDLSGDLLTVVDGRTNRTDLVTRTREPLLVVSGAQDFGDVAVGSASREQQVVVENVGPAPVTIASTLAPTAPFQVTDGCHGVTLAVGATCHLGVVFAPTAAGPTATVLRGSLNRTALAVALAGAGVATAPAGQLLVSPRTLDFGAVEPGVVPASRAVTITNDGDAPVTVTGGAAPTGEVRRTVDGCTGTTLAPGESCQVGYTLALTDSVGSGPFRFGQRWNGVGYAMELRAAAVDRLQVLPGRPNFGLVQLGDTARATVAVRNVGSTAVDVTEPLPLSSSAPHRIAADGCTGHTLAPGEQCAVTIEVTPTRRDQAAVDLRGQWNGQVLDQFAAFEVQPWLVADTSRLTFARYGVGKPVTQDVALTNTGDVPRTIGGHCVAGRNFVVDDCQGRTLAPGETVRLGVTPSAFATGPITGDLVVTSPSTATTITIPLAAQAVPAIIVPATRLQLGPEPMGSEQAVETVEVTNGSPKSVTPTVAVSGVGDPDVTIVNTCVGKRLRLYERCSVQVTYRPTRAQHTDTTLRIVADGVVHEVTVTLWAV